MTAEKISHNLVELSRVLDERINGLFPDMDKYHHAQDRIIKIGEEFGEVVEAMIGVSGTNPRKGVTHSYDDVINELLDVAASALGAVEYLTGNQGRCMGLLEEKTYHALGRLRS